ncbi:MAG: stage III sporulation protein AF [Oscillibacter sp.]|jgi:stage III sporulation protein AF|nr:stage III sporulation protein AF [Oscillibacter sp.]
MIDSIRSWITAVVAASILISAAETLVPKGTLHRIFSMTGGLLLCIVLLRPLAGLRIGDFKLNEEDYAAQIRERQAELENENSRALEERIARSTETYIEDKASALGISCTAAVKTAAGADGIPRPTGVELNCGWSEQLSAYLSEELGIPRERQVFHGTKEKK